MQNTGFVAPIPGVGTSGRRAEKSLVNTNVPVYSGFTCRSDWGFKTHTHNMNLLMRKMEDGRFT